jgi:hypothetical protein
MKRVILWALAISFVYLLGAIGAGYIFDKFSGWRDNLNPESVRYVLSAMAQSLAALFALILIVISWISAYSAKSLIKDVFKFVLRLKITWITLFIFILAILQNFIYLGFISDKLPDERVIFNFSIGYITSILLFIISIVYLAIYAYKTYRISIEPISYFSEEIIKSFGSSIASLKKYYSNALSINQYVVQGKLKKEFELAWSNKNIVKHSGKPGYVCEYDEPSIRMAYSILNEQQNNINPISYQLDLGDQIQIGAATFAFTLGNDHEIDRVIKHLNESIKTTENIPLWVPEFDYIRPMFEAAFNKVEQLDQFRITVNDLVETAKYYLDQRHNYEIEESTHSMRFDKFEFTRYWFDNYDILLKKVFVYKAELKMGGKIFEDDEPDYYLIVWLLKLINYIYKYDNQILFKQLLKTLWQYAKYSSKIESANVSGIMIKQLKNVVEHLSYAFYKSPIALDKYIQYVRIIIDNYLSAMKGLSLESNYFNLALNTYNHMRSYFIDNMEDDLHKRLKGKELIESLKKLDEIRWILLSYLFALLIRLYYDRVIKYNDIYEFMRLHKNITDKLVNIAKLGANQDKNVIWKTIIHNSHMLISDLGWFVSGIDKDREFDENRPPYDTRIYTYDYLYQVLILTLIISDYKIIDPLMMTPDDKNKMNHYYKGFKKLIGNNTCGIHKTFITYCNKDLFKIRDELSKIDDLTK